MILRPSNERGNADHGWLKTFHTFSFAMYGSPEHDKFGSLRVLNEDRVAPGTGFGAHSHKEFEIFSYIVDGELQHNDSMGNCEVLKRGDLQMTSAGTGIQHSEKCHGSKQVHFLQIWAIPSERGLAPKYYTRNFSDEEKQNKWVHIVAPASTSGISEERDGVRGPAPVHAPLNVYSSLVSPATTLDHAAERDKVYVHVVQRSGYNPGVSSGAHVKVSANGDVVDLREGDGVYVDGTLGRNVLVENVGEGVAEVILFDVETFLFDIGTINFEGRTTRRQI